MIRYLIRCSFFQEIECVFCGYFMVLRVSEQPDSGDVYAVNPFGKYVQWEKQERMTVVVKIVVASLKNGMAVSMEIPGVLPSSITSLDKRTFPFPKMQCHLNTTHASGQIDRVPQASLSYLVAPSSRHGLCLLGLCPFSLDFVPSKQGLVATGLTLGGREGVLPACFSLLLCRSWHVASFLLALFSYVRVRTIGVQPYRIRKTPIPCHPPCPSARSFPSCFLIHPCSLRKNLLTRSLVPLIRCDIV